MADLFPYYTIGHFINEPNNATSFEITQFGNMEEPNIEEVHKHTFYEILWVDKGKSQQTIDYHTYELRENSLFFISPGQVHTFEQWQSLEGGTILFDADFFLLNQPSNDRLFELVFLDNAYANPNVQLSAADFAAVRHIIDLLMAEKNRSDSNPLIVQSLLHILLLHVQRSIDSREQKTVPKRAVLVYKQFRNLLEKTFTQGLTTRDYASALHITQHYLNRTVKEVTGKTTTAVLRERSMLEAKRLLTFSDSTVTEIATALGYFDSSYFAKLFKKDAGMPPLQFREIMSEKYRTR